MTEWHHDDKMTAWQPNDRPAWQQDIWTFLVPSCCQMTFNIFCWEPALWLVHSPEMVLLLRSKKSIPIFTYNQWAFSLDMKTKVARHAPKINRAGLARPGLIRSRRLFWPGRRQNSWYIYSLIANFLKAIISVGSGCGSIAWYLQLWLVTGHDNDPDSGCPFNRYPGLAPPDLCHRNWWLSCHLI